jgi:hypothetical protein
MKYPRLTELPVEREMIDVFKGYNHNIRIGEGEFYDMTNLSSDNYPTISPRKPRGTYHLENENIAIGGMLARGDELWFVKGYYTESKICKKTASGAVTEYALGGIDTGTKTMISMGAYIIIMPDKKYINTANPGDKGDIISQFYKNNTDGFSVSLSQCTLSGKEYDPVGVSADTPEIPDELLNKSVPIWWVDTSSADGKWVLKEYDREAENWNTVDSYVKLYIPDSSIGKFFEEADDVTVDVTIKGSIKRLDVPQHNVIYAKGDDYVIVKGVCDPGNSSFIMVDIKTTFPEMDFLIEAGNRLWGCRYGKNNKDVFVNEIYASKLGEFKHWTTYKGISTDSYVASVGASGPFTGAINYGGYPMFFKENCLYKIYGNYPAQYQIQEIMCNGVEAGSSQSLSIVNDVLYYKSRAGICAYDGSLPVVISSALGDELLYYRNAVGGVLNGKYYVSMSSGSDTPLYVYDSQKNLWHKESESKINVFCNLQGNLYYLCEEASTTIKSIVGRKDTGSIDTESIQWQAITGEIGTNSPDKKSISRLDVRMRLSVGSEVIFFIEYDSSGEYEYLFTAKGTRLDTFTMPVKPKKCDHLRLKIMGVGDAQIYSITKTVEYGG